MISANYTFAVIASIYILPAEYTDPHFGSNTAMGRPTVFTSYTHESDDHNDQVYSAVKKLREAGIDCGLDRDADAPIDWQQWSRKQIRAADYVLIVWSPDYCAAWEDEPTVKSRLGSRSEARLLRGILYKSGHTDKVLSCITTREHASSVPADFSSHELYVLNDDASVLRLIGHTYHLTHEAAAASVSAKPSIETSDRLGSKEPSSTSPTGIRNVTFEMAALAPWRSMISKDDHFERLWTTVIDHIESLLEANESTDAKNQHSWRHAYLWRHAERVLGFLNSMCLVTPYGRCKSESPGSFVIASSRIALLAAISVPFHTLYALPYTLRKERIKEPPSPDGFVSRLNRIRQEIEPSLDDWQNSMLSEVYHLSVEMFRDSPFWEAARKDKEQVDLLEDHQAWCEKHRKDELGMLSRALRQCDAMDVGHRIVPDVVQNLFQRMDYPGGKHCYYYHTFLRGHDVIVCNAPVFNTALYRLEVPFIRLVSEEALPAAPVTFALEQAGSIIRRKLVRRTMAIWEKRSSIPANLQCQVEMRPTNLTLASVEIDHINWALFGLAIALPASDSRAMLIAAELLPSLVQHILDIEQKLELPEGDHFNQHVPQLFAKIKALRHNSHAMTALIDGALEEFDPDNKPPSECVLGIQRYIDESRVDRFPIAPYNTHKWDDVSTNANAFILFGVSRAFCSWLVSVARRRNEERLPTMSLRPIYHVRRLKLHDETESTAPQLFRQNEHDVVREELAAALEEASIEASAAILGAIDFSYLPMLLARDYKGEAGQIEILLGARSFVSINDRRYFVNIYGTHALICLARQLGIPVRIVTWEERLDWDAVSFDDEHRLPGFEFTYALHDTTGESADDTLHTEDELVPVELVTWITTEKRTIDASALTSRPSELLTLPPKTSP